MRIRLSDLREDRGAAAVEFALIMPILFLLVFGIFEFGRAYNAQVSLTGAAREGARVMAIRNDSTCNTSPAGAKYVVTQAASLSPALTCGEVAVTPTSCVPGANVTVTATRVLNYSIPTFVDSNGDGVGSWTVTGKAVMRCGG